MKKKIIPYNPKLRLIARELRKNLTYGEARLWKYLKSKQFDGYDFHRQKPIGNYIVDFYCPELDLIIEIDGGTHDEKRYDNDQVRQKYLESLGLKVIRFSEYEVLKRLDDVLQTIDLYINTPRPS